MRGAIVSLDSSRPYGSWRWGGPQWTGQIGSGAGGRLTGITVAVSDPAVVAARWGEVLGVGVAEERGLPALGLDGAEVRFEEAAGQRAEGLVEIAVELAGEPGGVRETIELGGVSLELTREGRAAAASQP
jgi:hypothetical protein